MINKIAQLKRLLQFYQTQFEFTSEKLELVRGYLAYGGQDQTGFHLYNCFEPQFIVGACVLPRPYQEITVFFEINNQANYFIQFI